MPLESTGYPVNLVVAGRPCLVVGAGSVAARKIGGLLDAGALVTVVAPEAGEEVEALAAGERITLVRRRYRRGEAAGYRLVLVAAGDPELAAEVFEDAEAADVWVNAADDPAACTFTLPAVLRRGALAVTVSTGGRSPALAAWLRDRLAGELGEEFEVLVELLGAERERIRAEGGSTEGVDWQRALDSNMLDLIRAGEIGRARERLQACLSSS